MAVDVEAFRQAGWERSSYLCMAALLAYEYFLQLGNEVEYFWLKRWSFGKCLFLWSRYYSLFYNAVNAFFFMQPHPSLEVCLTFFHAQNTCTAVQMITTHVILELRLYAMYGRSKKILLLLFALISCEATAMGVLFGVAKAGVIGTNNPYEGVFICADGDPLNGSHWIMFYWVAVCSIESCLLGLALYKAWEHRHRTQGGGLMRALTRDSVLYFIMIFWIYLANLVLWAKNRITLDELGTSYSLVISVILANRLMISVRSSYYQKETTSVTNLPSIAFNDFPRHTEPHFTTQVTLNEGAGIELDRFDAQHGF
ncbi:hypothetical protein PILCRDRAFT_815363 [Piloderma croceum F 1598]|uniref:DUF6533 domain-containing protein n=1 Tax=Piloderma croceum (strain F 1598) TaxID=765440 RepID=A0A0C3CB21_PILCF|nr:hypothetical protein PILCRDRAFT_815363 [Piloderma croceum F 1598]